MVSGTTAETYETAVSRSLPYFDPHLAGQFEPSDVLTYNVNVISGHLAAETDCIVPTVSIELARRQSLLTQLKLLMETPEDGRWPDATWPSRQAFDEAKEFICHLPLVDIPMPVLSFADDGEINFLWQGHGVHVDLGFHGTGAGSCFARDKDGNRFHYENLAAVAAPPSEIRDMLADIV